MFFTIVFPCVNAREVNLNNYDIFLTATVQISLSLKTICLKYMSSSAMFGREALSIEYACLRKK